MKKYYTRNLKEEGGWGDWVVYKNSDVKKLRKENEQLQQQVEDLRKCIKLSLPYIDKEKIPKGLAIGLMLMIDESLDVAEEK